MRLSVSLSMRPPQESRSEHVLRGHPHPSSRSAPRPRWPADGWRGTAPTGRERRCHPAHLLSLARVHGNIFLPPRRGMGPLVPLRVVVMSRPRAQPTQTMVTPQEHFDDRRLRTLPDPGDGSAASPASPAWAAPARAVRAIIGRSSASECAARPRRRRRSSAPRRRRGRPRRGRRVLIRRRRCGGAGRRRRCTALSCSTAPPARVHVELPPLARVLGDAAENHVAGLGAHVSAGAAPAPCEFELVDALDRAADGGEESAVHHLRAVTAEEAVLHVDALDGVAGGDEAPRPRKNLERAGGGKEGRWVSRRRWGGRWRGGGQAGRTRALQPPTRLGSRRGRTRTHHARSEAGGGAAQALGPPPLMSIKPISRRRRGTRSSRARAASPAASRSEEARGGGQPARGLARYRADRQIIDPLKSPTRPPRR